MPSSSGRSRLGRWALAQLFLIGCDYSLDGIPTVDTPVEDARADATRADASMDASVGADMDAGSTAPADETDAGDDDSEPESPACDLSEAWLPNDVAADGVPVVDGVLSEGEWPAALWSWQCQASEWNGNSLQGLAAAVSVIDGAETLRIAIIGSVNSGNALAVYFDVEERGLKRDFGFISSERGDLDRALSCGKITAPKDFTVDYAWGATEIGIAPPDDATRDTRGEYMGWRDLEPRPFFRPTGQSECKGQVCEASLVLPAGVRRTAGGAVDITLFARITNAVGTAVSDQTLPFDDPDYPGAVHQVYGLDATRP